MKQLLFLVLIFFQGVPSFCQSNNLQPGSFSMTTDAGTQTFAPSRMANPIPVRRNSRAANSCTSEFEGQRQQAIDRLKTFFVLEIFDPPSSLEISQTVEHMHTGYRPDGSSYTYSARGPIQPFEQITQRLSSDFAVKQFELNDIMNSGRNLFTLQGGRLFSSGDPMEQTKWSSQEVALDPVTNLQYTMVPKHSLESGNSADCITVHLVAKQ